MLMRQATDRHWILSVRHGRQAEFSTALRAQTKTRKRRSGQHDRFAADSRFIFSEAAEEIGEAENACETSHGAKGHAPARLLYCIVHDVSE
jgi:hypothetical protein